MPADLQGGDRGALHAGGSEDKVVMTNISRTERCKMAQG
jgi:hypothetical protein